MDTTTLNSPGWWFRVLAEKMSTRNTALTTLENYMTGNAPLPEGAHGLRAAYQTFQQKARVNFAELIVEAVQERMTVTGFRVGDGEELSKEADRIWSYNELDTFSGDVHADMLGLRDGYAIVAPGPDGIPVITREDPMLVIAEMDPLRPSKPRAALKMFRDEYSGFDTAYLYLPGVVYCAQRKNTGPLSGTITVDMTGWEWVAGKSPMRWPRGFEDVIPVVRWHNKNGVGEYERHTDTLNRINYTVLQRLVITALQAYRQRAVKGSEKIPEVELGPDGSPLLDADGNTIPVDVAALLTPGPGALWLLPEGVDLWESGTTDITPILAAAKDDIRDLAASTRTPMHMLMPDGANQSAEGASAAREQLVYKAADRIKRASYGWNQAMALALRMQGAAVNVLDIETLWSPPERLSLAERADAASKLIPAGVPWRTVMTDILHFSPEKVEEMEKERMADALALMLSAQGPGNGA